MATHGLGQITQDHAIFLLCDMQEKFRPAISHFPQILEAAKRLLDAATILKIPIIATEQNSKALGKTVGELQIETRDATVVDKTLFSMLTRDVVGVLEKNAHRKSAVVFGIETHICVLQTTLDLLKLGYEVHVVADAVSSRNHVDRMFALERLRQSGAIITTTESLLFQIVGDATHPHFKDVQKLIMTLLPSSGLL